MTYRRKVPLAPLRDLETLKRIMFWMHQYRVDHLKMEGLELAINFQLADAPDRRLPVRQHAIREDAKEQQAAKGKAKANPAGGPSGHPAPNGGYESLEAALAKDPAFEAFDKGLMTDR